MEYSDEKEVVVTKQPGPFLFCDTKSTSRDSDKQVTPVTASEKISVLDNLHDAPELDSRHDAPELDSRHDAGLEVAPSATETGGHGKKDKTTRPRLCGMPKRTAYWVFAIAVLLAIATIIAASVATKVAKTDTSATLQQNPTPIATLQQTSTPIATSDPLSSPTETSTPSSSDNYTCPSSNNTTYNTSYANSANYGTFYFLISCDIDWPAGSATTSPNVTVKDLSIVLADSMEQCMNQCALYSVENDLACMAVTYQGNKTLAMERDMVGGNCWLKNGRGNVGEAVEEVGSEMQAAFVSMMTG